MTKPAPQSQGSFSFFNEVEKKESLPELRSNALRPPTQVEITEKVPAEENELIASEQIAEPAVEEEQVVVPKIPDVEIQKTQYEDKRHTGRGRRSVKEGSLAADMVEIPPDEQLFQKQYYSMAEVTAMFRENHSLIRYWETEFDILKPKKNGKGDRFFRPEDIKNLQMIHDLLRRRKFTIEGARDYLERNKNAQEKFSAIESLQKIKAFLLELKAGL